MKLRPGSVAKFEKSLARRTTRDVEPHVYLYIRPPESPNGFGDGGLCGLLCPSRSFMEEPNDSFAERTRHDDQLTLGIVKSFHYEHAFQQRYLLPQLSQSFDSATVGSEVVGCRGPMFIEPGPE